MAPRLDTAPTANTGKWVGTKIWQWVRAVGTAIVEKVSGLAKPSKEWTVSLYPVWPDIYFGIPTVHTPAEAEEHIVVIAEPIVQYVLGLLSSGFPTYYNPENIPNDIRTHIQKSIPPRLREYTAIRDMLNRGNLTYIEKTRIRGLINDMLSKDLGLKVRIHLWAEPENIGKTVRTISRRPDTDTVA
jgi:hypothetical protein